MTRDESIDHDFVQRLKEAVEQSSIDPTKDMSFKLAALYVEFRLPEMRSELTKHNITLGDEQEETLTENCLLNKTKGTYTLQEDIRIEVINSMSLPEIDSLISGIEFTPDNWRQHLYSRLLKKEISDLKQLLPAEYVQAYTFFKWIKHPDIILPTDTELLKLIHREDLLTPLRKLTVNFSSRVAKLKQIEDFVWGRNETKGPMNNCMFITGVGGVGKSTLVNKFILNQLTDTAYGNMPFIHIDFDNPDYSISDVFALLKEGLNQLSVQKLQYESRFKESIKRISFEYNKDLKSNTSRKSDREFFFHDILTENDRKELHSLKTPVLTVFDSFEELQFRSSPSEIDVLFQFIEEITLIVPMLRAIFIGRAEIIDNKEHGNTIVLDGFELSSAVSFLKTIGLTDEVLCNSIFDKFGGNPLTLQLAANLVIREMDTGNVSNEEVEKKKLFEKIDRELIQQQLVARNLDHIHNRDLAKVAVPGILLRKINPDIIKNVLAGVCGLGEIDDEKASELFEDLKKESFLLKRTGDKVEFRKDLRTSLYDLILKNPIYKALQVHDAAVNYYRNRSEPSDQAEYLFHCLKRGDDITVIDSVYQPAMKSYLETALSELPVEARVQLSQLMGIGTDTENLERVSGYRWELYMLAQVRNVLEFGDEKQLINTQLKLKSRAERTNSAEFAYFENLLNLRLLKSGASDDKITSAGFDLLTVNDEAFSLRFFLLQVYDMEFHQQYNDAQKTIDLLFPYTKKYIRNHWLADLPSTKENISLFIDCYFVRNRILSRTGKKYDSMDEDIMKIILDRTRELPEIETLRVNELFALFPKVYAIPIKEAYIRNFPNADLTNKPLSDVQNNRYINVNIIDQCLHLVSGSDNVINAIDFSAKYNYLKTNIKTSAELERYTRRAYKVFLKDFCLPGTLDICLFDFLLFVEALPRESKNLELEKLTLTTDFSGKRNQAVVDDFINVSEVKACLERLERVFTPGGKRSLVVSDVLDEEGHQYVNLVQRSSGVHHIALLGYTYILEKMGIRFLKIAGTNTGTINTAILGACGRKSEANTTKLLEHVINLNYFSLVDGPPLLRNLFKIFGTTGNFLNNVFSIVWGLITVLSLFILLDAYLISNLITLSPRFSFSLILSNIGLSCGILIVSIMVIYCLVYFFRLIRRITTFGSGLNPGAFLYHWLQNIFNSYDILNVGELEAKISETPKLLVREGVEYKTELLKGDIVFICADVVTQNRILFPAMTRLFWDNPRSVEPALLVRAAASTPFFFNSQMLKSIPVNNPDIQQAWIETFGEYDPPIGACFVDGSMFSFFPISIFQDKRSTNAPLPTFGVDTSSSFEKINSKDISKLNWFGYFQRLLDTAKYNLEQDQVARSKALEKAICRIKVDKTGWLNYFLTDEEKLELFTLGAKAATEFLINFDWEEYKRSLDISHGMRL